MEHLITSRNETSIVVTHGFALSFAISAWFGVPIEALGHVRFRVDSASITELAFNPDWGDRSLVTFNETGHLSGS